MSVEEQKKQNELSFLFLEKIWVEEKDLGNKKNIKEACISLNLDFEELCKKAGKKQENY